MRSGPDAVPGSVTGSTTYLVEWWDDAALGLERTGHWVESGSAAEALASAFRVVDGAWTSRIRMTLLFEGANHAAVNAGRAELEAWNTTVVELPRETDGPVLPPRSADDIRSDVLDRCRDAFGLALRAHLISHSRSLVLLLEIDKSFDAGRLDEDRNDD